MRLYERLAGYLATAGAQARVFLAPADIQWGKERLVQPDLFVVPLAEVTNRWVTYHRT